MLRGYPGVRRWEQTDDILQNAALRLCRALEEVQPASVRSFINLAAVAIRRELIDLARHYHGPEGMGRHHISWDGRRARHPRWESRIPRTNTDEPARLALWTEFHTHVDALPDAEKRGLRPRLVSGPVAGRGRRAAGGHRGRREVSLAFSPAQAARDARRSIARMICSVEAGSIRESRSSMETDARIDGLIDRWEELHEQGTPLTIDDLCADCPELVGGGAAPDRDPA